MRFENVNWKWTDHELDRFPSPGAFDSPSPDGWGDFHISEMGTHCMVVDNDDQFSGPGWFRSVVLPVAPTSGNDDSG
jgi:hypothetical protein